MAENRASGPQLGQDVYYSPTVGTTYPAKVTSIAAATGLVRLTTFAPGGSTADAQSVKYDGTGTTAPSWRYPDMIAGL